MMNDNLNNLSKLSLDDKNAVKDSPSHPRQRIQFYQEPQLQTIPFQFEQLPPPTQQQTTYEQQPVYEQPLQQTTTYEEQPQKQEEITSLEFGIDLPNISDNNSNNNNNNSIDSNSIESGNWFEEIIEYQKQNNNTTEDVEEYLRNHNQSKLEELLEKKQYDHPVDINIEHQKHGIDLSFLASSKLILNRHDQLNKSNLPNGFLLSPFYYPISTPTSYDYHPPQCKNCYSYVNIYCKLNNKLKSTATTTTTPMKKKQQSYSLFSWTCSICLNENHIDDGKSGVRSIVDVVKGLGWWSTHHYKSVFSSETFDIKIKKNKSYKQKSIGSMIDNGGEMDDDGDNEDIGSNTLDSTKSNTKSTMPPSDLNNTYIFLIDENISTTDLKEINESIKLLVKELPENSNIGLITFSKNISLFEMNSINSDDEKSKENLLGFNSAKLISGANSLGQVKHLIKRKRKLYLETIGKDIEQKSPKLNSILTSLLETFENNGDQVVYESKPISLGIAIESAMQLIVHPDIQSSSRFFVFLNGSPDFGPGSIPKTEGGLFVNTSSINNDETGSNGVNLTTEEHAQLNNAYKYYENLGEKAYNNGIAIDIAFIGYNNFESRVLSKLCHPSGFITSSLDAKSSDSNNRAKILFENMNNAIIKNSGIFGQLDIHTHDSINLTHLIGPTINNPDYKNNRLIQSLNDRIGNKEDQLILPSLVDSSNHQINDRYSSFIISNLQQDICFSIYYSLLEDLPLDYIHFQFVIHLIKSNGIKISRVVTKRLRITGNFDRFLSSLDFKVTSVLLSKKLVLQSLKDQKLLNINPQIELDKLVKKIALSCSKVEKGWFRKSIVIPDIIKNFIKLIYKIRRGLIFGSIIQNDDDLIIHQNYLLNSNFIECQKLLLPKLLLLNNNSNRFNNIPLDVCAINPNVILILDCFTNIYVMIGSGMKDNVEKLELLEQHLKQSTYQRIPSPFIIKFSENEHDIRWMKSILSSSESYPIQERIDIIKEIYPEYQNVELTTDFLKRFDDPFSNQDTPAQYEREIITNLL